ncbi:hypothetical protein, partial [Streptomyces sp. 1-11]|uniref:hypothetical protein n=1 Tax=Streptomyces sp. 1-11 TaxID=2590549 RepID=UPI001C205946
RWLSLRSSHLVALCATEAGPAARVGQRAFGPSSYKGRVVGVVTLYQVMQYVGLEESGCPCCFNF